MAKQNNRWADIKFDHVSLRVVGIHLSCQEEELLIYTGKPEMPL
ncbi:MAG: hypothetical protein QMA99_07280 [Flavobacterium sp.]